MKDFGQADMSNFTDQILQQGQQAQQENPLMSLMREYVRAKEQFDVLCHQFAQVSDAKAQAEARLQELSKKVAQVVSDGVHDPTKPQPGIPMGAGQLNGGFTSPNPRY